MTDSLRKVFLVSFGASCGILLRLPTPGEFAIYVRLAMVVAAYWLGFAVCYWAMREDGKR